MKTYVPKPFNVTLKIDPVILRKLSPVELRGVVYRQLKKQYGREVFLSRLSITDENGRKRTYHLN